MGKDSSDSFKRTFDSTSRISSGWALVIWLIIFIILIVILRAIRIRWFSNIVFSALVAAFILPWIFPLRFTPRGKYIHKSEDWLLGLILFSTAILVIIYIIWKVFTDREERPAEDCEEMTWWGKSKENTYKQPTVTTETYSSTPKVMGPSVAHSTSKNVPGPF